MRLPVIDVLDRCATVDVYSTHRDPEIEFGVLALAGTQRIQQGLPPATAAVWRELAQRFPKLTGLGAWGDRSHQARRSCHNRNTPAGANTGPRAVDAMTRDRAMGDAVVKWALANRAQFGITTIIWWGQIWSAKNGWKPRRYIGRSAHKDHVHLSIHCNG